MESDGHGGYNILVDKNHDGHADFIGHDTDGDGILESAEYDRDFDGRADFHATDVDEDGEFNVVSLDTNPYLSA